MPNTPKPKFAFNRYITKSVQLDNVRISRKSRLILGFILDNAFQKIIKATKPFITICNKKKVTLDGPALFYAIKTEFHGSLRSAVFLDYKEPTADFFNNIRTVEPVGRTHRYLKLGEQYHGAKYVSHQAAVLMTYALQILCDDIFIYSMFYANKRNVNTIKPEDIAMVIKSRPDLKTIVFGTNFPFARDDPDIVALMS